MYKRQIYIYRHRQAKAQNQQIEDKVYHELLLRHFIGIYRDRESAALRTMEIANEFDDGNNFSCSVGYMENLFKRNNIIPRRKTTNRQSTIHAYIRVWKAWIDIQRCHAKALNLIHNNFIIGQNCVNLDEFALCPDGDGKRKHIAPKDAHMILSLIHI